MIRCRYILFTMVICVIASAASADLTDGLISVFLLEGIGNGMVARVPVSLSICNPDTTVIQYGNCTEGGEGWFNYRVDPVDDGTWHHTANFRYLGHR